MVDNSIHEVLTIETHTITPQEHSMTARPCGDTTEDSTGPSETAVSQGNAVLVGSMLNQAIVRRASDNVDQQETVGEVPDNTVERDTIEPEIDEPMSPLSPLSSVGSPLSNVSCRDILVLSKLTNVHFSSLNPPHLSRS